jgi:anti-anti-sigma factor
MESVGVEPAGLHHRHENEAAMPDTTTASNLLYANSTRGCGGAQMRAHCRHLATVVTIRGEIDDANVDRISEYARRLILAENPLILDLSDVDSFAATGISLFYTVEEDCREAGLEWMLIPSNAVSARLRDYDDETTFPIARSVHEALQHFADVIAMRRQLLLPLVRKTA